MYKKIYVPVDNSAHSNRAIESAVRVGKAFSSELVGCHVYAAKMHDYRFKQMEYSLPEEYLEENELERQRKIHDSLITMGLELISDSYLEGMKQLCVREDLPFEGRMIDGKHHVEIRRDLERSDCDLVVLGALGLGRQRDSQIGAVCERVTRSCRQDVWVVRHLPKKNEPERDTILVGIDGSPQSFGALETALELARAFDKRVEIIGVYDPYLHYHVFNGLVGTLTEKASKVFRFEEQNQLHEEIIDTGLAQIYQSHLEVAQQMAGAKGTEVDKTLLDGKTFQKDPRPREQDQAVAARPRPDRGPQRSRGAGTREQHGEPAAALRVRRSVDHESCSAGARRPRGGEHPLDPRSRGAHGACSQAGRGHRAHCNPASRAREGSQRHHKLAPRRRDGAFHAQAGPDGQAGRGGRHRAVARAGCGRVQGLWADRPRAQPRAV